MGAIRNTNRKLKIIFNMVFQIKVVLFFFSKRVFNNFLKKLSSILLLLPHLHICAIIN